MSSLLYFLFQVENGRETHTSSFAVFWKKNPNKLNKLKKNPKQPPQKTTPQKPQLTIVNSAFS